jgi:hypothetical protein
MERPLFLNDDQIAVAVLGAERAHEWPAIARELNAFLPLPPIHRRMKARFWPDIVEYFRHLNSVDIFNDKLAERMKKASHPGENCVEARKPRHRKLVRS